MLKSKNSALDRYQILQLYLVMGGIPYYLDALSPQRSAVPILLEAGINEPSRNTVAEVYNQIIKDLKAAKAILGDVGIYRFSADAADALLARVYLYKGDWAEAENKASILIEGNGKYMLAEDVEEMFAGPESLEEIFTLKFEASEDLGMSNLGSLYNPNPFGQGKIVASSDLIDLYEPGDMRLRLIEEHTDSLYYQSKYEGQDNVPGLHSPKILRLAEMYLIRAEARMRNGIISDALDDLNVLREKRGASKLTGMSLDIIDILDERHRELAFEGHTSFDYWRTGTNMVRIDPKHLEPKSVEAFDSCKIVHPIPQSEMDANPNMKQNCGY